MEFLRKVAGKLMRKEITEIVLKTQASKIKNLMMKTDRILKNLKRKIVGKKEQI